MSFRTTGAKSPEATANEPNEQDETNEMLLSEFYELAQRVEQLERSTNPSSSSPTKSQSPIPPSHPVPSHAVGFTSPGTPLTIPAPNSSGKKSKKKKKKATAKKRRPKRGKDSTRSESEGEGISRKELTLHDLGSSSSTRKSPISIPWAKTPTKSIPRRFTGTPAGFDGGFDDSEKLFEPLGRTSIMTEEEGRRPLLIAKKIYGHLVNLQGSYMSMKKSLENTQTVLGTTSHELKATKNTALKIKEENGILRSQLRAAKEREGAKARIAQKSLFGVLSGVDRGRKEVIFRDWRNYTEGEKVRRRKMARFLKHWRFRHAKMILSSWGEYVKSVKARKTKIGSFHSRWTKNMEYRALEKWRVVVEEMKSDEVQGTKVMQKFVRRMGNLVMMRAFSAWYSNAIQLQNISSTTSKFLRKWRNQSLSQSYVQWFWWTDKRKRLRRAIAAGVKRKKVGDLRPMFKKWCDLVAWSIDEEWLREQDGLKKVIKDKDTQIRILENFRDMVYAKEKDRAMNVLNRILHSQLFAAWKIWKEEADELTRLENIKLKIMNKWRLRGPQKMLMKWKLWVEKRCRVRNIMKRSFGDRSFKMLASGFNTWRSYTSASDTFKMRAALEHMEQKIISLEEKLKAKTGEAKVLQKFKDSICVEKKENAVAILYKMVNHKMMQSFEKWLEWSENQGREERVMKRFLSKWRLKSAVACMLTWREYTNTRLKLKRIVRRATVDKRGKMLDAALRTWKHFVYSFDTTKLQHASEELNDIIVRLENDVDEKDETIKALRSHVDNLMGSKKLVACKMLKRACNGKLNSAWLTWLSMYQESVRTEVIMKRFALKIKNSTVLKCFETWLDLVETRKKMRNFVHRHLFDKTAKVLSTAFRTWIVNTEKVGEEILLQQIEDLREEMARIEDDMESVMAENQEFEGQLVALQKEKLALSEKSMRRFVNMWQNKALLTTLNGWKNFITLVRRDKGIMKKWMLKMLATQLNCAMAKWMEFVLFERRCEKLLDKFARKWIYRNVCKTFGAWVIFAKDSKSTREGGEAWERKVSAVLSKMMNGRLLKVFNAWRDNASEKKKNRLVVKNFVNKMRMGGVRRCISRWREFVAERVFCRRFMNRMVGGREATMLRMGWNSWRSYVKGIGEEGIRQLGSMLEEQHKRIDEQAKIIEELEEHIREMFGDQQERAIGVIQKMLHNQLNQGFMAWKANVEELKRHEGIVKKFGNRIRLSSASKAMQSLRANRDERQFLRRFLKRMVGGRRVTLLAAGLNKWREVTVWLKNHSQENEIEKLEEELESLTETLQMYEERYAKELLAKKDKARRVISKLMNGKVSVAWDMWVDFVKQEIHNEEIRLKFAKKLRYRGAMKALENWKIMTLERKFLRRFMKRMFGGKDLRMKSAAIRTWQDSVRGYREGEEKEVIQKLEGICNSQSSEINALQEDLSFLRNQVESLQSEKMMHSQKAMKNFIALWQNKGLLKVFTGWKNLVVGLNERRVLLARVVLKWQGRVVVRCFKAWAHLIKKIIKDRAKHTVVKEGEWQDFLRDARTVVNTPKAVSARGGGAFFNNNNQENEPEVPTVGDLDNLEHLSPHTIRGMNTMDLQQELAKRGLPSAGSKPALIARLTACQDFLSPRSAKASYRRTWNEEEDEVSNRIQSYARKQSGL
ncbi:hypothetical protein TrVE_jg10010 [Triparma verrucosa]|uniref:SAP domain-containing protein n=1 Tax=Triparma verrucosa TaxID=1606542 RepID=A0A9W7FNA4_9STRA|nr:hypothetical protein TrVE_jg10010 [Triparma verrucosa]